jgi:hypothetical protein
MSLSRTASLVIVGGVGVLGLGLLAMPATAAQNPPPPVTIVGPVVPLPFATLTPLTVACPVGKTVLSGGFAEVLADGTDKPADPTLDHALQAKADRPNPSGAAWDVTAWNAATPPTFVKVYARCA